MCDIWKANREKRELSAEDIARHLGALRRLGVRWVVLSGGEALMHPDLWTLCALLREIPVRLTLLSTGLLLRANAGGIARWFDEVIVSLDGGRAVHDAIRGVPRAYDRLAEGVAGLREVAPGLRVSGRSVLQRRNYFDLPELIRSAHELGLDQISFLAADVSSTAFNRPTPWSGERAADVALTPEETTAFAEIVERVIDRFADDFASGFVAESPEKLRRLPRYYAALNGGGDFPPVECNAPWVSAVVEADGTVRPCFFHRALGSLHERPLDEILNSREAREFRRDLDVRGDPVCRRCVCSLSLRPTATVEPPRRSPGA
jgi:MoaA/NifB/PqqE/SkfB family radical SAM enzyme